MLKRITEVVHDDTRYLKGALGMRTQKCFAVKVMKPLYKVNHDKCCEMFWAFYAVLHMWEQQQQQQPFNGL